jgi:hypothetical protein
MQIIVARSSMPWCRIWTLSVYGRKFYLGQDVKFCHRVLNIEPRDVVNIIGGNDLTKKRINANLARFICFTLDINRSTVKNLSSWSLAAD